MIIHELEESRGQSRGEGCRLPLQVRKFHTVWNRPPGHPVSSAKPAKIRGLFRLIDVRVGGDPCIPLPATCSRKKRGDKIESSSFNSPAHHRRAHNVFHTIKESSRTLLNVKRPERCGLEGLKTNARTRRDPSLARRTLEPRAMDEFNSHDPRENGGSGQVPSEVVLVVF